MISLYPSHIHISFPYSHILPYPYISHIPVFIFLSISLVALLLVFFHFFILWRWGGVCFSCGFLVLVLWMVSPRSSSRLSFRSSPRFASRSAFRFALRSAFSLFRFSSRLSFRLSARFTVLLFDPLFGPSHRFVSPFRPCRVGGSWNAPFLSARLGLVCVYFSFVLWCRRGDV